MGIVVRQEVLTPFRSDEDSPARLRRLLYVVSWLHGVYVEQNAG